MCLLTLKQIVPRLIEHDDVISQEGALKWNLPKALEWFAPTIPTLVLNFAITQIYFSEISSIVTTNERFYHGYIIEFGGVRCSPNPVLIQEILQFHAMARNISSESTYQDSIEESDMELDAYVEKLEQKLLSSTPARSETTHKNSDLLNQQEADKEAPPQATLDEEKGNELKRNLSTDSSTENNSPKKLDTAPLSPACPVWRTVFKTYGSRSSLILRLWQTPH